MNDNAINQELSCLICVLLLLCAPVSTVCPDDAQAWAEYKQLRNKVNNRRKFEEKNFKSGKISQSLDSPADTWKTAKEFMDW